MRPSLGTLDAGEPLTGAPGESSLPRPRAARPGAYASPMGVADVVLLAWVALLAVQGFFRGFAAQAISLAGIVVGGGLGAWLAPNFFGDSSPWLTFASLGGAFIGALVLGFAAGRFADRVHRRLSERRELRLADAVGGIAGGVVLALVFAWLATVLLLHEPGLGLRKTVQTSRILPALVRAVPPNAVLRALDRFDPLPLLPQLADENLPPPDPSVLASAATREAARSVVKVEGVSCGLGVQGSGWVVRVGLVATNAHVVAGQTETRVIAPNGRSEEGTIVYLDTQNDVALVRVEDLGVEALDVERRRRFPARAAVLGYPGDGALTAVPATAGEPRTVLAPDAYGGRVRPRTVVPLRGAIEHGESGGPVVDRGGAVFAMVFGGQRGGRGGYAVPVDLVMRAIPDARRAVDPGACIG